MFPPDMNWSADFLKQHREPGLWEQKALRSYAVRLRMSAEGINCLRSIIRLDQSKKGWVSGVFILENKCGHLRGEVQRRIVRLSGAELARVIEFARSQDLLQRPRQGWLLPNDEICLDGQEVLIEIRDANGYRAAGANMSCTAPASFRQLANMILEISGAKEARSTVLP
jgi:hypothetical protein